MTPRRKREPTDANRDGRDEERLVGRDEKGDMTDANALFRLGRERNGSSPSVRIDM